MDNLNDIQQLWKTGKTDIPPAEEMLQLIAKFRRRQLLKTIGSVLLISALAALMVWVVFAYDSRLWTTRAGEACFFAAMVILFYHFMGTARDLNANYSNTEFLQFLKREQKRLIFFHEKLQWIGFTFACAGLVFYVYETLLGKSYFTMVYGLIAIYILAGWLIVRPRVMKRKIKKMNDKIERLEKLSGQLQND